LAKSFKNATIQRHASGKFDDLWLLAAKLPSGLLEESLLPVHVCVKSNEWRRSVDCLFTKVAKPDILASIAGAPSVQKIWSFSFQSKFCLAKNLLPFPNRRRPS
jgi:hypothetical protein